MLWAPRKKFPCLGLDAVQTHIGSSDVVLTFVSITRGWRHKSAVFLFLHGIIHNSLQKNIEENLIYGSYCTFILSSSTCEAVTGTGLFWAIWMSWLFISVHFLIFPRASDKDSCIAFGVAFFHTVCSKGNEDGTWLEWSCPNYETSGVILYGKHRHS